jgi:voltage-gated potassium channel
LSAPQMLLRIPSIALSLLLLSQLRGIATRRKRSWVVVMISTYLLVFANYLATLNPWTSVSCLVLIFLLISCRRRFRIISTHVSGASSERLMAIGSILLALTYGTTGSYFLRSQFEGIKSWVDAFYFTFITYSTLGYGDMLPMTSTAKLFTISMIAVGLSSFVTALAIIVGPFVEKKLKGVMDIMAKFDDLSGHVIVCGYSSVAGGIVEALDLQNIPCIIIDERIPIVKELEGKGHNIICGDPARSDTLDHANAIEAMAVIAASESDSFNTMLALAAAEYKKSRSEAAFRIIARVEDLNHAKGLDSLGVAETIAPCNLAGKIVAEKILLSAQGADRLSTPNHTKKKDHQ